MVRDGSSSGRGPLSEEARAILDASPVPALALRDDLRILHANAAAVAAFGADVERAGSLSAWLESVARGAASRSAAQRLAAALADGDDATVRRTHLRVPSRGCSPRGPRRPGTPRTPRGSPSSRRASPTSSARRPRTG